MPQIPLFKVLMAPEAATAAADTLQSGTVTQGPRVDEFESVLQKHFSSRRLLTTNSCTSAIHLALHVIKYQLNLANGAEVICTPLTCAATNFPVLANRMRICWADIDPTTLNISTSSVMSRFSRYTRVLLFVHWGGFPVAASEIAKLKKVYQEKFDNELIVIEDCAHAWGSQDHTVPVGAVGGTNFACYSFQAIKALTTTDGGALIAPSEETYRMCRKLRWFGLDRDNKLDFRSTQDIETWGYKFHMNDLAASIGLANYSLACDMVRRNQSNAAYYQVKLRRMDGLQLPPMDNHLVSSCWLFTIRAQERDNLQRRLTEKGIQTSVVHHRNDAYTALRAFQRDLPAMDLVARDMLCIPVGWWLSEEDREYIVNTLKEGW